MTVVLCALLELIDSTVVNVALSQLMGNLGATLGEVSWVIASYAIANVIIVPMAGWLSSQFGRKKLFYSVCYHLYSREFRLRTRYWYLGISRVSLCARHWWRRIDEYGTIYLI